MPNIDPTIVGRHGQLMELLGTIFSAVLEKLSEHLTIAGIDLLADSAGSYMAAHPIVAIIGLTVLAVAGAVLLLRTVKRRLRR